MIDIWHACNFNTSFLPDEADELFIYDLHQRHCANPLYMHIIYKSKNGISTKIINGLAFQLDIPKNANITKANFDCTVKGIDGSEPNYTIKVGYASPKSSSTFVETCEFQDVTKLESTSVSWDLSSLNLEIGTAVSKNIKILLQEFVNHDEYTPRTYFQLVIFEESLSIMEKTLQGTFRCNGIKGESIPILNVEWS